MILLVNTQETILFDVEQDPPLQGGVGRTVEQNRIINYKTRTLPKYPKRVLQTLNFPSNPIRGWENHILASCKHSQNCFHFEPQQIKGKLPLYLKRAFLKQLFHFFWGNRGNHKQTQHFSQFQIADFEFFSKCHKKFVTEGMIQLFWQLIKTIKRLL